MSENETQWFVDMQSEIVGAVSLEMLRDWLRVQTITISLRAITKLMDRLDEREKTREN